MKIDAALLEDLQDFKAAMQDWDQAINEIKNALVAAEVDVQVQGTPIDRGLEAISAEIKQYIAKL